MITIVEPIAYVDKLWGKQYIKNEETYRLMNYVLQVNHNGNMLLHNSVTGRLVVLDSVEADLMTQLPRPYDSAMEQLVKEHFLVPNDYNEYQQVLNLRMILRKLDEADNTHKDIFHYTIFPTTACNARCYYCFEQGTKNVTMTEDTADDVVEFIKLHCGEKSVVLSWFGGEPTLADNRIDQICRGLKDNNISYSSDITTNGYLFDEEMVRKAKELWRLKYVMICVDGTEENYNKTKSYIYKDVNPYQVVMRNIGLLLAQSIKVHLRMNFDVGNYTDFSNLVKEVEKRFYGDANLIVTAHPIIGKYKDYTGRVNHGSYEWFESKLGELNDIADEAGFQHRSTSLPWLKHRLCMAASDSSLTITADGNFVSCPQQFGRDQWKGNLKEGVIKDDLVKAWKETVVYDKCRYCVSFPDCVKTNLCSNAGNCCAQKEIVRGQMLAMKLQFDQLQEKKNDS